MEHQTNQTNLTQVAEVELVYKSVVKPSQRPQIRHSDDAYELLLQHWDMNKIDLLEQFKTLFLNRADRVIGIYVVSTGGITGTVVDIRLILVAALKAAACSLILVHNHPSGLLRPSKADAELTEKIKQACAFLDLKLLDHLIISSEGYLSFANEGIL